MHKPGMIAQLRVWATRLTREVTIVYRLARDPRVHWGPRLLAFAIAAYVLSPIDLIPDFIPVLGLLDELVLVPAGLWLVFRLVPAALVAEHRAALAAQESGPGRLPRSRLGAVLVIAIWLLAAAILGAIAWRYLTDQ